MPNTNYYISTSIPYVNGPPHIGHAMEFVLADVIARYHKQYGREVFFSTGTDEHGGKVMEKAAEVKLSPEKYAEQISATFRDMAANLNVEYTKFIRTTDKEHETRAAVIWQSLAKDIYKGSYTGMYDQREETFLTPDEAKDVEKTDPERYARLQELKEDNYFFRLAKYTEPILDAIKNGDMRIIPETRHNELVSLLEGGLQDISISRPTEKIPWGIPVPGDPSQTMYVWFEALMNYITTLGYPEQPAFSAFWPANVQIIGKDILRFHGAIWPAMLMGLGVELPKVLYVHGHINVGGEKMSKSVGNVLDPNQLVKDYGAEAFRYFIVRHIPSGEDGDFSPERFENAYNSELGNELGNLVQRTVSMINKHEDGVIGELPESMHDIAPYHEFFEKYRFDLALDYVWTLIRGLNQFIEEEKPWKIAAEKDNDHIQEVLAYIAASLLQIADLIYPVLPQTAAHIITTFGEGIVKSSDQPLFPRINNHTEAKKHA